VITCGATTTPDTWQPTIAVAPSNGAITASFYDRRNDPANFQIRVIQAVSTDGGQTWTNVPIPGAEFEPAVGYDPVLNPNYMGDYNQAMGMDEGAALVWTDLRNRCQPPAGAVNPCSPPGRPDMDVYSSVDMMEEADLGATDGAEPVVVALMATPGAAAATPAMSLAGAATPGANVAVEQGYAQVYDASCPTTYDAVEATLATAQEPVAQANPNRGVIQTASVPVDNTELKRIVAPEDAALVGQQNGRYVLAFQVRCPSAGSAAAPSQSLVATQAQIIINNPNTANMLGGFPVRSSGVLETEHLDAVGQVVPSVTPNLAVTTISTAPELPITNIADLPTQSPTGARVVVVKDIDAVLDITQKLPPGTPVAP
jgi:hypothetical protein